MENQPPRFLRQLLKFYCNPRLLEELEGDLEELFQERLQTQGLTHARWRYFWDLLRCIRPYSVKRKGQPAFRRLPWELVDHSLRLGWRQLVRHQSVSVINLFGLATALTACLGMAAYVLTEWSFDSFHRQADRIFLVELNDYREGQFTKSTSTVPALGPAIQAIVPEVEAFCRLVPLQGQITYTNPSGEPVSVLEERVLLADSTFWQMFSFSLTHGNPASVLTTPFTAYLSRSTAQKYFGTENAIGQVIRVNEHAAPYSVAGVFDDVPFNSHLQFNVLLSYVSMDKSRNTDWNWSDDHTYVLLREGVQPCVVERKMDPLVRRYHSKGSQDQYCLQPLRRLHLHPDAPYSIAVTGDSRMVAFLALVAGLILFIALVNYTNIAIAQSLRRTREIGVRKVMGALPAQLSVQFVSETLVLHVGVLLLAAGMVGLVFPLFQQLTRIPARFLLDNAGKWTAIILVFTLFTLMASYLPTYLIAQLRNWELLKGPFARPLRGKRLRKTLIVLQYAITLVLGVGTWVVYQQINFLRGQDLGIEINQVLIIRDPLVTDSLTEGKFERVKSQLLTNPHIRQVSFSSSIPGKAIDWHRSDIKLDQPESEQQYSIRIAGVGYDYFRLYGLPLLAGRSFSPAFGTDQTGMVISEKAAQLFGFAQAGQALGHLVFIGQRQFRVIGVVKDYHHLSFHHELEPQLYMLGSARRPNYSIRLATQQLPQTLAFIEKHWQQAYPGNVFDAFFLDEFFDRQYTRDQQFGKLMNLFSGLALLLSLLGLWSFAFFNNQQRSKEIAIRKVVGGSVRQLVGLLLTEYLTLLLVAYGLAIPVIVLGIQAWLTNYTVRIPLHWWLVGIPAGVILLLTILAIGRNTYQVSNAKPTQFLRND